LRALAYEPAMAAAWNAVNRAARNGHFMFDRGFMDYHADRFADASMTLWADGRLAAILPASRAGDEVVSHGGLTFGGLVNDDLGVSDTLAALDAVAAAWAMQGARRLTYKPSPAIYHLRPAQEDLYWLFRREAPLVRRDVTAAIDYRARGAVSSRRTRGARKAAKAGVAFRRVDGWGAYWTLLEGVLQGRHGVRPTHSLAEIELLAGRFPGEIELHVAEGDGELQAGVVMFVTPQVAHAQYIAASEAGRETGALDGLFEHLIHGYSGRSRYFDFGISNTEQGRVLNEGLIRQKEEFGASAVAHDFYEVALA